VMHAMFLTKLKLTAAVVLALGVTGTGIGVAVRPTAAAGDGPVAQALPPAPVVQAAEPAAPVKPVVEPNDRTLDLIKQARDTLQGEMDQAEKVYREFRTQSPYPAEARQRLQTGLATLSASLDQYAVRRVELSAQVEALATAVRESGTGNAGVLLLVIQR